MIRDPYLSPLVSQDEEEGVWEGNDEEVGEEEPLELGEENAPEEELEPEEE